MRPRILSDARLEMARAIKRDLDAAARRRTPPTPAAAHPTPPTGKPIALDAGKVYQDRAARATTTPKGTTPATPPRPTSFQALVAGYYGTSADPAASLIQGTRRGGGR